MKSKGARYLNERLRRAALFDSRPEVIWKMFKRYPNLWPYLSHMYKKSHLRGLKQ